MPAVLALPESKWPAFAERLAGFMAARRGPLSTDERGVIGIIVGNRSAEWVDQTYWPEVLAHKYLSWMQILACHRPGSWRPTVRLVGKDHLDQALDGGRGALLFTATFAYRDLMAKAAIAEAGFAISHLSMDSHGFSDSRFGKRWLNPIYTSVEERYLRERLVFSGDNTKEVSAKLRERLKQNAPVMITVTPLGRRVATLPFLGGQIHIATGGLNFACENDTPVLPVFTLRQGGGVTATMVGSPLDQPAGAPRSERIGAMLEDYVARLEVSVLDHPEQFSFPLSDRSGRPLLSRSSPAKAVMSGSGVQEPAFKM
ncbi:MAG: hypothetical protein ACR2RE_09965 [Geminicoccaceae bacterium]